MKKQKLFFSWFAGAFLLLLSISSWATNPTYICRITNAAQVSCNVWEFDVTIARTGATVFNLAQWQLGILMNPACFTSGSTISVAPVPGSSSGLNINAQPPASNFAYDAAKNCIYVTPVIPTATNYTVIPLTPVRLCRIRVASSTPFVAGTSPFLANALPYPWNFVLATGYVTRVFALVGSTNVDVTVQASHTVVAPYNPVFTNSWPAPTAQTVTTDVTEFCNLAGSGATIGLATTQAGYTYYLYNNGVKVTGNGGVIFGNNNAQTFGTKVQGPTVTVKSPSCTGDVTMLNTISLTPLTPLVAAVSIAAAPPSPVPPATLVTFTATPVNGGIAPGYQWYVNDVPDYGGNGNAETYDYTPVNGDQIKVDMYSSEACLDPNTVTVTSNTITMSVVSSSPPAAFNITGAGSYCQGSGGRQIGLDGSQSGVNYQLKKDNVNVGSPVAGTGLAITPAAWAGMTAGTYTVFGTDDGTNTSISGTTEMLPNGGILVTETPLPVATITPGGPTTFCAGGSVLLTASAGDSYLWLPGGATTQAITVSTGGSYTVAVTTNGCTATSPATVVTVNPYPVATITPGGPTTFCEGGSVVLTASAGDSYLWSPGGQNTQAITVSAGGSYTVTVTTNGCSDASDATVVTVNPIPVATITPGGPTTFCQGGSVVLTASAGDSYLWSPGGQNTQAITVSAGGSYTVTVTTNGCSGVSSATVVTVNPIPVATITPGGPTTFCEGGSVVLTASAGDSYMWSPGGQITQAITVSSAGSYTVTVMTNGCSGTSAATVVTVNPIPVATITPGGPTTFCEGGSVVLTASAGDSYMWSPGGQITQAITVSSAGSYTVTVMTNGCSGTSAPTVVTVNPMPVATITPGGPTTFCEGGSVVLTASAGDSYLWSPGGQNTQAITVSAGGSYTVTVTTNGCSGTSAATVVTVNPIPVATITPGGPTTFCAGGSVVLTASAGDSYMWSPGGEITQAITVNAGGSYTVTVTTNGCSGTSAATDVTVNPVPVATITPGGPTTFCEGGSVVLTASAAKATDLYLWSPGGETTQSITVTAAGSYSVTITRGGCSGTSAATIVTVNPFPGAAGTIAGNHHVPIASTGNAYSIGAIANATSYVWNYSGTGATINGNGTMNVTVDFLPTATEGQLSVKGSNACGFGAESFFDIFFDVPTCATATWNGSVDENWNNPLNWDGYCVPAATTNVTIPAGKPNYPTLMAAGTCNNINLASGTSLLDNSFLTVHGTATVQRAYSGSDLDWHLISSPISSALSGMFTGKYLQSFSEATNAYSEIVLTNVPLNVMEGYGLYSNTGLNTAVFSGNLNLGVQTHGFTATSLGWNLLGNPFVSSIDWEAVTIPAGLSNEVHYIDAATGNDLSYVKGVGGTGSQYIPAVQGFFVSATAPGTFSVGDAQRTHLGGNLFYKSDNPKLVVLEAAGNNYSDQAWIHFNEQAGVEHDGVYDAYKRISTSNPALPQIYSTTPSGSKMSVNGMPQASTVPVGFTAVQSGTYTISAVQTGEFTKVTLEDLFNNTFTDLLTNSYQFTYTAGDQEGRFLLHFNGVSVNENQADLINIYSVQKDVYVSVPAGKIGSVKILNMLGQEVTTNKIVDVLTKLTVNQIGIYVVQVKMENGKIYTKKVIIR